MYVSSIQISVPLKIPNQNEKLMKSTKAINILYIT